jgi:hypothetical protein
MHGLQRARADGCPAFLETGNASNVPFYESLGFQVVGEERSSRWWAHDLVHADPAHPGLTQRLRRPIVSR